MQVYITDVSREYTKQRSKEALKPRQEATIEAINKALNILSNDYEYYIASDIRYPGYTYILADMSKAIEILEKYKR